MLQANPEFGVTIIIFLVVSGNTEMPRVVFKIPINACRLFSSIDIDIGDIGQGSLTPRLRPTTGT